MTSMLSLENLRLEKILRELYTAQKCTFFMEDAMGKIMDQFSLSEQQAIELAKMLMDKQLISTNAFLPATFLRPRYIRCFPIVLTAKAISMVNKKTVSQ
ncbi:hypothetical protein [Desulfoscipio gibsoniae]|uniref:Uncharacterized protein n=1 Tax=Desulfoscipio gibsoniae DSM 7213 TaxID=767817 RepID=R4KG69_9FIRM|nr:hypothetical protein [Desulfoscipio gibsoniae]AGL01584.1 hypothetical protein Desgi_2151 [Desulfoscipio gibsoniae DSM 7213]